MTSLHVRERIRTLVRTADFVLTILFWLVTALIVLMSVCVTTFVFFNVNKLLGVGIGVATAILLSLLYGKKSTVGGLFKKVDETVEGQVDILSEMVHTLVEESLSSVLLSAAIVPGCICVAAAIAFMLHYNKFGAALVSFAAIIASLACCLYSGVRWFALREVDRVVGSLKSGKNGGKNAANERTKLLPKK